MGKTHRQWNPDQSRLLPLFHLRMMVTPLFYSYTQRCFSSRRIENRCQRAT